MVDSANSGRAHCWAKKCMRKAKFVKCLFIVWCYSLLYSLRLAQSGCLMLACQWVSLCPAAGQGNARPCEPLVFVASGKREEIRPTHFLIDTGVPQLWTWPLACVWIPCSGVARASGWGKGVAGQSSGMHCSRKLVQTVFLPPFPRLASVSVIENLPIGGLL